MALINKRDSNGVKPLLQKGEFGYDDFVVGGDVGRVYVGTGDANIALGKKSEIDTKQDILVSGTNIKTIEGQSLVGSGNIDLGVVQKDVNGNVVVRGSVTSNVDKAIMTYSSNNVQFVGLNTDTLFGNTGAYNTKIYTNGAERMRIDSIGNVGIGTTPSAWDRSGIIESKYNGNYIWGNGISEFYIGSNNYYNLGYKYAAPGFASQYQQYNGQHIWKTAPSGTAGNAINWTNAMTLDANGDLTVPHTYSNTTASAANMFVDSTGKFFRSTSSKQYKTDIEDICKSYADSFFNNARPIYYKSLSDNDNPNWGYWGFIAEEIAEFDKRLVHWRYQTKDIEVKKETVLEDGSIETILETQTVKDEDKPLVAEGVMYERITVLLTAKVQEQQEIINDLKTRLEILEGGK